MVEKQSVDLHTSSVAQLIAAEALDAPWFPEHLASLRAGYRRKRDALAAGLRAGLGDRVVFDVPAGGMFVWARLPGVDTSVLLERCLARGVCFVPGAAFGAGAGLAEHARLSFATASIGELDEAVSRLAAALR